MLSSVVVKQKFFRFTEIVHLRIFGHEMGDEMRKFLGNLSWSFFGGIIAGVILLFTNIVAGRLLGPEEYGKYNLVLAISSFLVIFMTLGLDAAAPRFVALSAGNDERGSLSRFILTRSALSIIVVSLLVLLLFYFIQSEYLFDKKVFFSAVVFSLLLSFRNIADGILRGTGRFRLQTKNRLLESGAVLVIFFGIYVFSQRHSFLEYVVAIGIGYLIFTIFSLLHTRIESSSILVPKEKKKVIRYGAYAMIGAFASFLFIGSDKIMVNYFLDEKSLGLYSAYFTIAIMPMMLLQSIVVNVFFPSVSTVANKPVIFKKINRLFFIGFIPMIIIVIASSSVLLMFFGEAYKRDASLVILFSILAVLVFFVGVRQWFLASLSDTSIIYSSFSAIIAGVVQLLLVFIILNNGLGLYGVIAAIMFSNLVFLLLNQYFIERNFRIII